MCAISRRGVGPVPALPKHLSNKKESVSLKLVFTRGGNPAGNPDMKALGESGVGAAALAAAGRTRKAEGGAHPPGGWTLKEEEAVSQEGEVTKYEVAYEEYKIATARSMDAFVKKANTLGYTWPRFGL